MEAKLIAKKPRVTRVGRRNTAFARFYRPHVFPKTLSFRPRPAGKESGYYES